MEESDVLVNNSREEIGVRRSTLKLGPWAVEKNELEG